MFRLAPVEMEYIINHCEAKVFLVQGGTDRDGKEYPWITMVGDMKKNIPTVEKYISFAVDNPHYDGFISYEDALAAASPEEPDVKVDADDIWVIMYTGGTTGKPKGVMKSHASLFAQYFIMIYDHQFNFDDTTLLVMPCCHVNSLFYSFANTWVGGTAMPYNMVSFDPEDLLKTFQEHKITFTSLVPTHYIMMLALPDDVKKKIDVSSIRQLLISSAPARKETKLATMEYFKNGELWEAYGSTEGGLVTLLRPEDQLKKLGSIGKEIFGTDRIKILDENRKEVPDGEVGELFYRTPMLFKEYLKEPEKSKQAFFGEWSSAGDMVKRDQDGYYTLVDRKANMIITGGENVYPSEVEGVIGQHKAVRDVAVIGVPDAKWGEMVKAIVVLHAGYQPSEGLAKEILESTKNKIAGFKRPKTVDFIKDEEMPRTPTGKILHRILREKFGTWSDHK
jgi:acyl-coenzyme A synthetase/AMP-(fatty) acid ligase